MFLTGPKVVAGGDRRRDQHGGPRRPPAARPQRRLPPGRRRRRRGDRLDPPPARRCCRSRSAAAAAAAPVAADGARPGRRRCPAEPRKVYDVRDVAAAILDDGSFLELSPRWAPNMVTGIARLEGRSVGLIANQPRALGGVIDAAASEKAALFVAACDRFGLPLLVFVDTPGFMPGKRQEELGVIRHGASLLRAFAGATVPKVTLVLRKAFGGAAITMNSKDLGADVVFSWPRRPDRDHGRAPGGRHRPPPGAEGGATAPRRDELADAYAAEHLTAPAAAASGWVDEVIEPGCEPRPAGLGAALAGRTMSVCRAVAREPSGRTSSGRAGAIVSTYVALGDSFTAGARIDRGRALGRPARRRAARGQPGARLPQPRRRRRHQRRSARAGAGGDRAGAGPGHRDLRRQRRPADLAPGRRGLRRALLADPRAPARRRCRRRRS